MRFFILKIYVCVVLRIELYVCVDLMDNVFFLDLKINIFCNIFSIFYFMYDDFVDR